VFSLISILLLDKKNAPHANHMGGALLSLSRARHRYICVSPPLQCIPFDQLFTGSSHQGSAGLWEL